jgi:uncharacterized protein (TIGR03067 family)
MLARTLFLAAAGFAAAAPAPPEKENKDQEKIQGSWSIQTMTRGGKDMPAEEIIKLKLVIDGEKFIPMRDGQAEPGEATFKLDPAKKPATIDVTNNKSGEVVLGIYKIDADVLTIAARMPGGKERPTEFAAPADSELVLIVLKRDKK